MIPLVINSMLITYIATCLLLTWIVGKIFRWFRKRHAARCSPLETECIEPVKAIVGEEAWSAMCELRKHNDAARVQAWSNAPAAAKAIADVYGLNLAEALFESNVSTLDDDLQEVPVPGGWPADEDVSFGPPYFCYSEGGKTKVAKRGSDMYSKISVALKVRR